MSIPARDWAWECVRSIALTDGQKVLLLWLAERASDEGHCWPTVPQIAQGVGVTERTIIRLTGQLKSLGLLSVEHSRGRGRANEYWLHYQCQPAKNMTNRAQKVSGDHLLLEENMTNRAQNMTNRAQEKVIVQVENMIDGAEKVIGEAEKVIARSAQPSYTTVIDQPSLDQRGVRAKRDGPIWGKYPDQEAFTRVEVARYAGLWTDTEVGERIDLALSHKSARNYTRLDLYVAGWLRRDAEAQRRSNGTVGRHNGVQGSQDRADKFAGFGIILET